jgi:hypothetical protein
MARALADVDRKDPALAGILSFLIPGVGSFYAGNSTHGFIHLGIHVVSYVLIVSSVSNAVNDCAFGDCSSSSTSGGELALGSIVLLGNDVWSIFTAVGDAHAHNGDQAKPGHVVGSLYFRPDVVRIGVPTPEGTSGRAGVQAFRVEF